MQLLRECVHGDLHGTNHIWVSRYFAWLPVCCLGNLMHERRKDTMATCIIPEMFMFLSNYALCREWNTRGKQRYLTECNGNYRRWINLIVMHLISMTFVNMMWHSKHDYANYVKRGKPKFWRKIDTVACSNSKVDYGECLNRHNVVIKLHTCTSKSVSIMFFLC